MDNSGVNSLATLSLTTALTSAVQNEVDVLDGMTAVTLAANFAWGSGGTTASVIVQTSFDGTVWWDIARFDFTTATRKAYCNLEGLLSVAPTTYAALSAEGRNDGLLGNKLRALITSTGTYANTVVDVRASVR